MPIEPYDLTLGLLVPTGQQIPEVVVSPFPAETWSDLWRIELEVLNRPGLLAQLVNLLADRHVATVLAEATIQEDGVVATITLIADCRGYASQLDLDTERRARRPRPELRDLSAFIAVNFIQDLIFVDGVNPQLKLRRLHSYFRLARGDTRLRDVTTVAVHRGRVELPPSTLEEIRAALGERAEASEVRTTLLADPSHRLLRVLFSASDRGVIGVRVFLHAPEPGLIAVVLQRLEERSFDIVRCQIHLSTVGQYLLPPSRSSSGVTFELVLRSILDHRASDMKLLALIRSELETTEELSGCNPQVELSTFGSSSGPTE